MTFADWLEQQPNSTAWRRIQQEPPFAPAYYVYPNVSPSSPALWNLFHLSDYVVTSAVSGPGYFLLPRSAAYAITISCIACGRRMRLSDVVVDLDGPAFHAYFCSTTCVPGSSAEAIEVYHRAGWTNRSAAWERMTKGEL